MKPVFLGTSEFALASLQKLASVGFEISAVVTQPDKPAGRGLKPGPSPVKILAEELSLKVYQPEKLTIGDLRLAIGQADVGIAVSYGQIIPKSVIDSFKLGILNLHPSLLPKYRGPSPIQVAILNGDSETGVTVIKMDEEMDHGAVVANSKFKIQNSKITYRELHDDLAELGAELLIKILPDYLVGKIEPIPQAHAQATYTKMIQKKDARIAWQNSADVIDRKIRAYSVWPVAWTMLDGKLFKIYEAIPRPDTSSETAPGEIIEASGRLLIRTGTSVAAQGLEILKLQLAGGKILDAANFLRGHRSLRGKVLT